MAPWNDTEDRQLLLSVISVAQVNPNWEEVSKQMGKTKEAVRQRFAKLKKEAGEITTTAAAEDGASPVSTPAPRKRKTKAKAKKAASDDEDEDEGTPLTKKSKQPKKIVKTEDEDEDEA
ncbi:unnamed protein product [Aureobasidium mustum]|uniref:Myb-like domain-containing protein n=1 Tax=Aureobasidium mustum TaxID=2773714 RepID=A0A9N8PKA3_9PEZI|nr:unnamed protein product [Aureobasidium mustum]